MHKLMLVLWLGGVGADAVSTHIALNRGGREIILTQSPIVNDAIIGGQAVGIAWGLEKLYKDHPKWAVGIGIVGGSLRATIAARNLRR